MRLSLIVAMSPSCVIGCRGQLPWHLSTDLRRFKQRTMGHAILMGRKTWDSIGHPLPGRTTIVMSRQANFEVLGARVAGSLEQAIGLAEEGDELFVVGGGEVFRQALPIADRLYVTRVHADVEGDVRFPPVDWNQWIEIEQQHVHADSRNDHDFTFGVYQRRAPSHES